MKFIKIESKTKGVFYLIISALCFAIMSAFVKLSGPLPSLQKAFFRNLVSFAVALTIVVKNRGFLFGRRENQKLLFLRAAFGTVGIVCNYFAIDHLILSDANMLNKLSPFFVIIFSSIFLMEKIKPAQFISILIAFVGALFIIKPSFNLDIMPSIIGLVGAIFAASAYTCLRALGGKERSETIVFYFSLFSLITLFPFLIYYYQTMTLNQIIYLVLAGIFASIAQFSITNAYKYAPAREISIFDYSNIIFSAIISLIIFGILPDILSVIGYIIIFSASLFIFYYNNKKSH